MHCVVGEDPVRLLERKAADSSIADRLLFAASRLGKESALGSPYTPRPEQSRVLDDFAEFLLDVATRPADRGSPFGRIILPPRTGKTVIAGHIIARAGLTTTFVVPTRTLVLQTARALEAQLPGVPIGVYYGERKQTAWHGVNVATYAILQRDLRRGVVPAPIAASALVFADEAHHAMTVDRIDLLRRGFPDGAVRVALTATPDYDDDRMLCRFFPELIHEITLEEALDLSLLAPLRVWVAEVDADGSKVRIVAGDFDEASLGRVMSAAPFARAVEVFRYQRSNARLPALVACASRQQAYDLHCYLLAHRPRDTPAPQLVLGETATAQREAILRRFEAGEIDTILQVGVLIEGWNSPRCKLLVDLAPSMSRVRATQKYFRVMTRDGGAEARIYVLLPTGLPALPILPNELFGASRREYECGALLGGADEPGGTMQALDRHDRTPVAGVMLKSRVLLTARFAKPLLDRTRMADIVGVLRSCPDFDEECPRGLFEFRALRFRHPLFEGRGDFLLRWLGIAPTTAAYIGLLARAFPESTARWLAPGELVWCCREDARAIIRALRSGAPGPRVRDEAFVGGFRAATGRDMNEGQLDPEERLQQKEQADRIARVLEVLPTRARDILTRHFGLFGRPPRTLLELAEDYGVSSARIGGIEKWALRRLRLECKLVDGEFVLTPRVRAGQPLQSNTGVLKAPRPRCAARSG